MTHPRRLKIEDYTYELPEELIARYPLEERDASRMLIYRNGSISDSTYSLLPEALPNGSLLVFNQTRVVPARLLFTKNTGGAIEVFCLEPHLRYPDIETAMQQRGSVWWRCMIGGASKWKEGSILSLTSARPAFSLSALLTGQQDGMYTIQFHWSDSSLSFSEVLQALGQIPLPPYMKRQAEEKDKNRYQTVYATQEGSVAAPTAGLHFTPRLLDRLSEAGFEAAFTTLHVGAGTFKPVKSKQMDGHDMHAEWMEVEIGLLQKLLNHEGPIIAVGTTTLRTIESLYWLGAQLLAGRKLALDEISVSQWLPYDLESKAGMNESLTALADFMLKAGMTKLVTRTQIMIAPGYQLRVAKGLITNFHQPQSTLILLVAALLGPDWRRVYNHALKEGYRFLSYGDGCLLLG